MRSSLLVLSACVVLSHASDTCTSRTGGLDADSSSLLQARSLVRRHSVQKTDANTLLKSMQDIANSFTKSSVATLTPGQVNAAIGTARTALQTMLPLFAEQHSLAQREIEDAFAGVQACHNQFRGFAQLELAVANGFAAKEQCEVLLHDSIEAEHEACEGQGEHPNCLCNEARTAITHQTTLCEAVTETYEAVYCEHHIACATIHECHAEEMEVYTALIADIEAAMIARQQEYRTFMQVDCITNLITTAMLSGTPIDHSSLVACDDVGTDQLTINFPETPPAPTECPEPQSGDLHCLEEDEPAPTEAPPVSCGAPSVIQHAVAVTPTATVSFSDSIEYDCHAGYTADGASFEISCQADGTFSEGHCRQVECPAPPTLTNAAWTVESQARIDADAMLSFAILQYQCNEGFSLTSATSWTSTAVHNVECGANGLLSGVRACIPINDCVGHSCGPFGTCLDQHMQYTCECLEGYEIHEETNAEGNQELMCGNTDDCNGVSCGEGGTCQDGLGEHTCDCRTGFELASAGQTCQRVECGIPPAVENTVVDNKGIAFEEVAEYECATGYSLDSQANGPRTFSVSCQDTGEFSAVQACIPIVCSEPELGAGYNSQEMRDYTFGETVSMQCNPGWEIATGTAHFEVECLATGVFSSLARCQNIDDCVGHACGAFGHCVDGIQEYSCSCENGFEEHVVDGEKMCGNTDDCNGVSCGPAGICADLVNEFVCECDEGHENEGAADSVCVPSSCERPVAPANWRWTDQAVFDTTSPATLVCEEGYSSNGMPRALSEHSIICNGDGSQSLLPAPCQLITHRVAGSLDGCVNGGALANAEVTVAGSDGVSHHLTTDALGMWSIDSVPRGTVTVSISLDGFSNLMLELNLQGDVEHGPADGCMNPFLEPHSWRVVLTWLTNPRDLDGHVTRHPSADGSTLNEREGPRTHLFWHSQTMGSPDLNSPSALLDRDSTNGYGPETITYFKMDTCVYDCQFVYRVWDYCSLPSAMRDESEALVRLYNADGLHSTYNIGSNGDYHDNAELLEKRWDVFMIDASNRDVQVADCSGGNCPTVETVVFNHGRC